MAWNADEKGNYAWLTKEASKYDDVDSFIDNIHILLCQIRMIS